MDDGGAGRIGWQADRNSIVSMQISARIASS
jgi:hypothetical protein